MILEGNRKWFLIKLYSSAEKVYLLVPSVPITENGIQYIVYKESFVYYNGDEVKVRNKSKELFIEMVNADFI